MRVALKLSFAFFTMLSLGSEVHASGFRLARGTDGEIHDSSVFPAKSSAVAASGGGFFISSLSAVLYGVHLSCGVLGNYVAFQDTEAYQASATTKTAVAFNQTGTQMIQFNPPLRFNRGLTGQSQGPACSTQGWCFTVIYDSE